MRKLVLGLCCFGVFGFQSCDCSANTIADSEPHAESDPDPDGTLYADAEPDTEPDRKRINVVNVFWPPGKFQEYGIAIEQDFGRGPNFSMPPTARSRLYRGL